MCSLSVLLQRKSHKKERKIPLYSVVPHKRTIDCCEKFSNDRFIAGQKETYSVLGQCMVYVK
jgi:hypothetical protein